MDVDLDLARIEEAARTADPVFRKSPQFVSEQLCTALGRNVLVKIETANPLGSFKGRGAGFLVRSLPPGSTIVCASSGNFGVALAYAARIRGMGAHVYVSPGTNPARLAMREPAPEAVRRMRMLVDDMVLVTDSALLDGMRLAARTLGILVEPSAAAGLAAIACHDLPGTTLATVLTGTDPGSPLLAEALRDRGTEK